MRSNGISFVRYVTFTKGDYEDDEKTIIHRIEELEMPWFVKPAGLGSSVGVSKVKGPQHLRDAIIKALRYDCRVIVEQGIRNLRELEIALLANRNVQTFPIGEVRHTSEFYDYETKYVCTYTEGRASLEIPADIPSV